MNTNLVIDKFRDEYFFLSNFYPVRISFEGIIYPSVENAYQAQKTIDIDTKKKFINISPSKAKKLGSTFNLLVNWDDIKCSIMFTLCIIKFNENRILKNKLISTFPSILIEGNTWNDTYWGICNGKGENNLGLILMNIRKILKGEKND